MYHLSNLGDMQCCLARHLKHYLKAAKGSSASIVVMSTIWHHSLPVAQVDIGSHVHVNSNTYMVIDSLYKYEVVVFVQREERGFA